MHKFQLIILCLLALAGLASCSSEDVEPSTSVIQSYIATQPWSVTPTATGTGLYFALTSPGTSSVSVVEGQELELRYTLSVLTSTTVTSTTGTSTTAITAKVVDTTYAKTATFFPFFKGSLKPGLEEGLRKMHEGDSAILIMPPGLAFNSVGSTDPQVAPNASVRYDVRLIRARTEEQQINEYIAANSLVVSATTASGARVILTQANSTGELVSAPATAKTNVVTKQLRAKTAIAFDTTGAGVKKLTGYTEGLAKLKVGEKATLIFPSTAGYAATGLLSGTVYRIAPYTPLLYEVEVISAK